MKHFHRPFTRQHRTLATSLLLGALGTALPAHAQSAAPTPPDPGSELRRQDERTQALRQREEAEVDVHSPKPVVDPTRLPLSESPCFRIDQLQIVMAHSAATGAEAATAELQGSDLAWLSDALAGPHGNDSPLRKCLGAKGVALVLKRAQDALLQRGLVTSRVLAQEQNLSSGTLTLTLVPGRVNAIRFKAGGPAAVRLAHAIPIHNADILNLRDVEQGLENLKRVPTAEADIQIEPAPDGALGQSDLVVSYQQSAPARLSLSLDDSGSKGTGVYQGSATLSLDNPLGLSDLFYFTASHDLGGGEPGARGTRGHILHYSLPLAYWLLGATYSSSRYYQSIAGLNQDYVYSGTSENTELKLARLVYRDAVRKTSLSLKAWQRRSKNFIDDTEVQVQRRVVGGWELGANHKEALGEATVEASLAYKRGTGDFDATPAPEEAFNEGTSKFGLWILDASASLPFKALNQSLRYSAALHVQDNSTPLTAQDRMAIGGRYTVRGFDGESSLAAERGWTLRNDLSLALGGSAQEAYLGLDAGEVSGPSAERLLGNTLSGAVLGLRGSFKFSKGQWQYDLFAGAPLYKPAGLRTAPTVAGFSLSLNF